MAIQAEVSGKDSGSIRTAEAPENAMPEHLIVWHGHRLPSNVQTVVHTSTKNMNHDSAREMKSMQDPYIKSRSQMAAINVPISVTTQTSRESL